MHSSTPTTAGCVSGARSTHDELVIAVEDSGIGIPGDKLERIFDEYYQVDTHGTKRMGVGLGLAIVKEVARLLGFAVKIQSRVGEGTQASLRIPNKLSCQRRARRVSSTLRHRRLQ